MTIRVTDRAVSSVLALLVATGLLLPSIACGDPLAEIQAIESEMETLFEQMKGYRSDWKSVWRDPDHKTRLEAALALEEEIFKLNEQAASRLEDAFAIVRDARAGGDIDLLIEVEGVLRIIKKWFRRIHRKQAIINYEIIKAVKRPAQQRGIDVDPQKQCKYEQREIYKAGVCVGGPRAGLDCENDADCGFPAGACSCHTCSTYVLSFYKHICQTLSDCPAGEQGTAACFPADQCVINYQRVACEVPPPP